MVVGARILNPQTPRHAYQLAPPVVLTSRFSDTDPYFLFHAGNDQETNWPPLTSAHLNVIVVQEARGYLANKTMH